MTALEQTPRVAAEQSRSRNAMLAVLIFALAPNIVFLLISPWLVVRRAFSPLLYILFGIAALLLPRAFAIPLFAISAMLDACLIVSFAFDMPFDLSIAALRYIGTIDVAASKLYLAGIALGLLTAVALGLAVNYYRAQLRSASLIPALLASCAVCAADLATGGFKPLAQPQTFESAVNQNGIHADLISARDRNLLIVIVEGMGAYANPEERALLQDRLVDAAGNQYSVRHGVSSFYGSTTGAESRELCGRWATFAYYLEAPPQDCLPSQLSRKGYETISYHAGYSAMFSRREWYPKIGIEKMNFREDIVEAHPDLTGRICGTVTSGLCDSDIGRLVHDELRNAPDKRKLVYWLTLNSHVPYAPRSDGELNCGTDHAKIKTVAPCQLTDIWLGVFESVAAIAADSDLPPLDILVVGDHHTPMWSRAGLEHFIKGKVDWYYMERQ